MARISSQKRGEIVSVHRTTANFRDTARLCGVSKPTARKWVTRFQETGDVLCKRGPGRKPSVSAAAAARAVELLTSEQGHSSSQVAKLLHQEGLTPKLLHRTTVAKAAKHAAKKSGEPIRCVTSLPAKRLTESNKAKRLAFAKANKNRRWACVLLTDRKRFLFRYPSVRVARSQWVKRGERRAATRVNHPQQVNLHLGICKHGCTPCKIVAGTSKYKSPFNNKQGKPAKNITSKEYAAVVGENFLPAGSQLFASMGLNNWVLQQDNDPAHKVAYGVVKEWCRQNTAKVEVLAGWPPNSPDLNPIENLWGILAAAVDSKQCQTFEEFQAAVIHACSTVPKSTLAKLINSIPTRLEQVVKNHGDMTTY